MGMVPTHLAAILVVAGGMSARASAQPEYDITVVDALASNSTRTTYLFGLNQAGTACGSTDIATVVNGNTSIATGGFVWNAQTGKTVIPISSPHGINGQGLVAGLNAVFDLATGRTTPMPGLPGNSRAAVLLGVNDSGTAVGYIPTCSCSNSQGLLQVPFVWSAGSGARTLPVPGATGAARINSAGVIVGWIGGRAATDGYVYDLGTEQYTLISSLFPPMNSGYTPHGTADDISPNSLVTGTFITPDALVTQGYIWHVGDASPVVLPAPPTGYTRDVRPLGINSSGIVVGSITLAGVGSRAFVYAPQTGVRDLNTLVESAGFTLLGAYQIDETGQIVGYGQGGGGLHKAFVLTPRAGQCRADFDAVPGLGVQDIFAFLNAWFAGEPRANYNGLNGLEVQDIFDFLSAWFTGC